MLLTCINQELADTNESLSDQTCTNQAISGAKMKCEQEMATMGHDLDEMSAEAGMSEEKAQRAMVDAARLAEELEKDRPEGGGVRLHQEELRQGHRGHADGS